MVSDWTMYGKLTCPYCIENNKAFILTYDGKTFFFFIIIDGFCHLITSTERTKKDVAPPLPSGKELYDVVLLYDDIVFDLKSDKQKFSSFGLTYN
jgi:hypothetical protein